MDKLCGVCLKNPIRMKLSNEIGICSKCLEDKINKKPLLKPLTRPLMQPLLVCDSQLPEEK